MNGPGTGNSIQHKATSKLLTCSNDSSSHPLCQKRIAPAINTLRAMGAGEKIEKSKFQLFFNHIAKDKFKDPASCISDPAEYPKKPWTYLQHWMSPPFLFLVLQLVKCKVKCHSVHEGTQNTRIQGSEKCSKQEDTMVSCRCS